MNFWMTFMEKREEWVLALWEHLQLSLLALMIAMMIAIPLGILLHRYQRLKEGALQVSGIFQTIPSLALLGLMIPFIGIGTLPAVVALVIYALFPILQATLTGLAEIDPSLEEAATAFGMTTWEKLKKYQLELAMPILMSGVRTASIMIIGTATLAALVGAGGLGSFILLGIDRNQSSLILIGALSSAFLAIVMSASLNWLQRRSLKTIVRVWLSLLLVTILSFIPVQDMTGRHLIIAGKLGAEPDIMIHLYKQLIEQDTDIQVELKPNFGKTSFLYEALKTGNIGLYPEYTGTIATTLLHAQTTLHTQVPYEVYVYARDQIAAQDQLTYLQPSAFQNTYALAVKQETAKRHNLEKISDLKRVESSMIAGFTLEFNEREDGNKGLIDRYGLNLQVKTMEPSLRYQAIASDDVQIIDVYSTDSKIVAQQLTLLADDQQLFPPYQVAPLLNSQTVAKYPEILPILEQLADKITTEEMSAMNYQVEVEGKTAEEVAKNYLRSQGLLKEH